jgi:hypothetical protein
LIRYNTSITIPSAATTGIEIELSVAAQISGTWSIGNFQLELGSTATTFEQRSIGLELALCQRYYEAVTGYPVYVVNSQLSHVGYKATKRAAPTIVLSSGTVNGNTVDGFNASVAAGAPINFSATASSEL